MQKIKTAKSLTALTHTHTDNLTNNKIRRIKNKTRPIIKIGF